MWELIKGKLFFKDRLIILFYCFRCSPIPRAFRYNKSYKGIIDENSTFVLQLCDRCVFPVLFVTIGHKVHDLPMTIGHGGHEELLSGIVAAQVPARTERYVRAGVTQQKLNSSNIVGYTAKGKNVGDNIKP